MREDFSKDSDVDMLVEFEPGKNVGLNFFGMQQQLSEIVGRKVDLNTPGFRSKYFRQEVLEESQVLYDSSR